MTPKKSEKGGKNQTFGGIGGQKLSNIVGHHLQMTPKGFETTFILNDSTQHRLKNLLILCRERIIFIL